MGEMKDSKIKKINVLGTEYSIEKHNMDEDVKLRDANGYCEYFSKKIILEDIKPDPMNVEKIEDFEKKVLRHEIVHALFFECGLSKYTHDEDLVDWIALLGEKLNKIWEEAGALTGSDKE